MSEKLAYYRVLYDYKHSPQSDDTYLNIHAGDVIEVDIALNENLSTKDWMAGRLRGTNEIGFFPSNYVERQFGVPRRSMEGHPQHTNLRNKVESIKAAPWYWEDISKEEVRDMMVNTPNGTYLVRDSTNKEENAPYTLTLRRNCRNMMIKIYHFNGKYGLMDTLLFNSVEGLVDHYTKNSLVSFNCNLDLKLTFPILKSVDRISENFNIVELRNDFKELCKSHRKLTEEFSNLHEKEKDLTERCKQMRVAIKAFREVIKMYGEQTSTLSKFRFFDKVLRFSKENSVVIKNKMNTLEKTIVEYELKLSNLERNLEDVRTQLDEIKSSINENSQKQDLKERLLRNYGETPENISLLEKRQEVTATETETVPHLNESLWLLTDCSREQAETRLQGRRFGTFLIRQNDSGTYVLSIVSCNIKTIEDGERVYYKSVYHCLIERKKSGFGFGEPFYIFKNLMDLVLYHKDVSLCQYNDEHDITLAFPVLWKDETGTLFCNLTT